MCDFKYIHDEVGATESAVLVVIVQSEEFPEDTSEQIEDIADQLAELIEEGEKSTAVYTFRNWRLKPGFPI